MGGRDQQDLLPSPSAATAQPSVGRIAWANWASGWTPSARREGARGHLAAERHAVPSDVNNVRTGLTPQRQRRDLAEPAMPVPADYPCFPAAVERSLRAICRRPPSMRTENVARAHALLPHPRPLLLLGNGGLEVAPGFYRPRRLANRWRAARGWPR